MHVGLARSVRVTRTLQASICVGRGVPSIFAGSSCRAQLYTARVPCQQCPASKQISHCRDESIGDDDDYGDDDGDDGDGDDDDHGDGDDGDDDGDDGDGVRGHRKFSVFRSRQ